MKYSQLRSVCTYAYVSDIEEVWNDKPLRNEVMNILASGEMEKHYKRLMETKEAYMGAYIECYWEKVTIEKALQLTDSLIIKAIKIAKTRIN